MLTLIINVLFHFFSEKLWINKVMLDFKVDDIYNTMDWMFVPLLNSYAEALISTVIVSGDGTLGGNWD